MLGNSEKDYYLNVGSNQDIVNYCILHHTLLCCVYSIVTFCDLCQASFTVYYYQRVRSIAWLLSLLR